jgi:tRNA U34 5-carboxymethylaminomethyl modifying GTPase MnmE/TrmE
VFCIDISKTDFSEDISIRELIEPKILIAAATKCDLLSEEVLSSRIAKLNELFRVELLAISSETGQGLEVLRETIDEKILNLERGLSASKTAGTSLSEIVQSSIALTARHKQAVTDAIENVGETIAELKAGNDEIAAMMLRAAYQSVSAIESAAAGHIDEQILEQIFSRFCIGK